jgi:hypothetical protein
MRQRKLKKQLRGTKKGSDIKGLKIKVEVSKPKRTKILTSK